MKLNTRIAIYIFLNITVIYILTKIPSTKNEYMMYIYSIIIPVIIIYGAIFVSKHIHQKYKNVSQNRTLIDVSLYGITTLNLTISYYANLAHTHGLKINNETIIPTIADAYYFSIVTFTTLGYGDFTPKENLRLIFASEAITGYIFFAILIGLIISITQNKKY